MKEALKLALEALWTTANPKAEEAITAIKAALAQECPNLKNCKGACFQCEYFNVDTGMMEYPAAQPVQEPVAWMDIDEKGSASGLRYWSEPDNRHEVALYTTPPVQPAQQCLDCGSNNIGIPATYDSLIDSVKTPQEKT